MFMNGKGKGRYERTNDSYNQMVIINAEEARRASIVLYNNGDDNYVEPVPYNYGSPNTHDYDYKYDHQTSEKDDEGFSQSFQSRAKQPPMMVAPKNSNGRGDHQLQFEDEEDKLNTRISDDNHVFNSFRDLYLELSEGTSPKTKSKDDYRGFNPIFNKPSKNLPTQGSFRGPSKTKEAMEKPSWLTKPIGTQAIEQVEYRRPANLEATKKHDKKEALENPTSNITSNRPYTKPIYDFGSPMNSPTKAASTERGPDKYLAPPNSGQKNSKTTETKEFPEKHKSKYGGGGGGGGGGAPLTKPTNDIKTAVNLLTESSNDVYSNIPPAAATKKLPFGVGMEGTTKTLGKYPPNSGEKVPETIGSKKAVEKYDGAFLPM